jgi:hypothetical protein
VKHQAQQPAFATTGNAPAQIEKGVSQQDSLLQDTDTPALLGDEQPAIAGVSDICNGAEPGCDRVSRTCDGTGAPLATSGR